MAPQIEKGDVHTPVFFLDNPLRRLLENRNKYSEYVKPGQVVADLGCGPGFFSIPLAEKLGPTGHLYAVDSDIKPIRLVERKAAQRRLENIEAHHTSASQLSFIQDESVDFVLADGLLCTMATSEQAQAVNEIKRIMKSDGSAFLVAGRVSISHVDDQKWESILAEFNVIDRNHPPYKGDYWALVQKRV